MARKSLFLFYSLLLTSKLSFTQYTKLLDFDLTETGMYPYYCSLYADGDILYGTTTNGGVNNDGTIFSIHTDGSGFTKLMDLDEATTGAVAESALISDGTFLYGVARNGGDYDLGTIYRLRPDGSECTKLHDFSGSDDGGNPHGSLYYDGTYLYGMTGTAGSEGQGTLYKLKPDGSEFTVLLAFDFYTTGGGPHGALISDGTFLYGMATNGGIGQFGTVFKIKPDGSAFSVLMNMSDDPNGAYPYGSLIYDGTYLYGMTNNGGDANRGTIFRMQTDGTDYQKLVDLTDDIGAQPLGSLVLQGTTLYGMAELGGTDFLGTMFSLQIDGTGFTKLLDFNGENGALPFGSLTFVAGALFGMTNSGGLNNQGVIFRYGEMTSTVTEHTNSMMTVAPNPVHDNLHIQFNESIVQRGGVVKLINSGGQVVTTTPVEQASSIPTDRLPAGIYQVILETELTFESQRVVIQ